MRYSTPAAPVSIIITNFNYARFLRRCIDSALGQTHPSVEVIVVDDVSTDGSAEIIKSFGDKIIPCFRAENGGHAAAFNTGFAASKGQVVFFLDADDYLYPNAVAEVIDKWNTKTAQVQFRLHLVDEDQKIQDVFPPSELPFDGGDVVPKLLRRGRYQTTVTSGLAFDRSALESVFPIPEADFRQGADGYLVTVAPLYGRVKSIDLCLGAYRQHGSNHSTFGEKLGERARWRLRHDFNRFAALSRQTADMGLELPENVGLRDPGHLEERLASLCMDRTRHPIGSDKKLTLAAAGVAASMKMNASLRRRAFLAAWFLSIGVLPRRMARTVLSWKLVASSRPPVLARMSSTVRRVMG